MGSISEILAEFLCFVVEFAPMIRREGKSPRVFPCPFDLLTLSSQPSTQRILMEDSPVPRKPFPVSNKLVVCSQLTLLCSVG